MVHWMFDLELFLYLTIDWQPIESVDFHFDDVICDWRSPLGQ